LPVASQIEHHQGEQPIMNNHNNRKPEPLLYQAPAGRTCPVCGKRSYSATGIHPQCAMQQADAPRQRQLAAAKRRERERVEREKAAAPPAPKKVHVLQATAR
jgi:hypothetical protein